VIFDHLALVPLATGHDVIWHCSGYCPFPGHAEVRGYVADNAQHCHFYGVEHGNTNWLARVLSMNLMHVLQICSQGMIDLRFG
jgi:hypothetical protein